MITPKIALSQQNPSQGFISAQITVGTLQAIRTQTPLNPNTATSVRCDAADTISFGLGYMGEVSSGDTFLDINEVPPQNNGDVYFQVIFTSYHPVTASINFELGGTSIHNDIAPNLQLTLTMSHNTPIVITKSQPS